VSHRPSGTGKTLTEMKYRSQQLVTSNDGSGTC